jgi:Fuc2NAc and GlcNAc transferase
MVEVLAAGVAAFVSVLILTRCVIFIGPRGQWWEPFSPRGSHTVPTLGRGGIGFVIFLSLSLPFYGLAWLGWPVAAAFTLAGLAIAFIGLLDDARPLPVLPRILVHILAVTAAGWALRLQFADPDALWLFAGMQGATAAVMLGLGWVWCVNLFNFMDGIDGIAAAEVGFVGVTASVVCALTGHLELSIAWALLAGSPWDFWFGTHRQPEFSWAMSVAAFSDSSSVACCSYPFMRGSFRLGSRCYWSLPSWAMPPSRCSGGCFVVNVGTRGIGNTLIST